MTPFANAGTFRKWLARNHNKAAELWVLFYKKDSGRGGITYPEALDEALCFGWIDGVRKRVDDLSYTIRFTPRTRRSVWSAVNIRRVRELMKAGRMDDAGSEAFRERDPARSERYSYEQENPTMDPALVRRFKANRTAWTFFEAQPPSYRRTVTWWIVSAKKDETRCKRLDTLIAQSEKGERIDFMGGGDTAARRSRPSSSRTPSR
jgi:uncharacterized protein YdeI (YjbR/CyaY-like superfamily)